MATRMVARGKKKIASSAPAVDPITKAVRIRRIRAQDRRGWFELLGRVLLIAFVAWFLLSQIFLLYRNEGTDMFPSLKDGDLLICLRVDTDYEKDDVVVYEYDGEYAAARIVAMGGDVVTISDSGTLLVNGTAQSGEIIYPTYALESSDIEYPYRVPEGTVFLLGDYRTYATDSRTFGPISEDDILGNLFTVLRRREF